MTRREPSAPIVTLRGDDNMIVRQAEPSDLSYVMALMRANRESVGGLPSPAVLERIERRTLLLALVNDDPIGYLLYDARNGIVRIPQACVQYDARRRKYAEALTGALLNLHADAEEIQLRCAADLEANLFWREMGFLCLGTTTGGKRRGRKINYWTLWLTPRLILASEIATAPLAELRQDSMYDQSGYLTALPEGFEDGGVLPKIAWANRKIRSGQSARHVRSGIPDSTVSDGVAGLVYDPFGTPPASIIGGEA